MNKYYFLHFFKEKLSISTRQKKKKGEKNLNNNCIKPFKAKIFNKESITWLNFFEVTVAWLIEPGLCDQKDYTH